MQNRTEIEMLRWGVLGFGSHARKKKLPSLAASSRSKLQAIATRSAKAGQLSERFANIRIHDSYNALLEDPDIDAVYIGLPNHLHREWTIRCLQSGKHVLCDKPIGLTLDDALAMRHAAEASGCRLREAFAYRLHPQHHEVLRLINDGAIGELRLFESHFHFTLDDFDNIRLKPECGGGGLLDVGCYTVDAARLFFGRQPEAVSAVWHIGAESRVDESCFIQLRYPQGAAAQLSCGCRFGWGNWYSLYGTAGRITLQSAYIIPPNKPGIIELERIGEKSQTIRVPPVNQYVLELDSFAAWAAGEPVDELLLGDGVETMRVLDAVRAAAESGRIAVIDENK